MVHAFVSSRLDCNNSLLYGLPNSQLFPLQRIQNSAARLVTRCKRRDHVTPILRQLHWLPVQQRIQFKILMTYKAYHGLAPVYICELISGLSRTTNVTLRSANRLLLNPGPRVHTSSYGGRAFSVAAPNLWNKLPDHIRRSPSLTVFKSRLKTYLFN